ncbi:hypothetical protein FJTKL_13436 [Diaporthe vaccinii]|uniref:Uncharacterized protein n=1 Tax=Diaporthe vaccinii TaxID=105482 RepID=A0ABR4EA92_9PEZI
MQSTSLFYFRPRSGSYLFNKYMQHQTNNPAKHGQRRRPPNSLNGKRPVPCHPYQCWTHTITKSHYYLIATYPHSLDRTIVSHACTVAFYHNHAPEMHCWPAI